MVPEEEHHEPLGHASDLVAPQCSPQCMAMRFASGRQSLEMEQCFPPLMVMVFASVLNRCFVQVSLVVLNVRPVVLQLLQTAGEVVDGGTLR